MKPLIISNWKMNFTLNEAIEYLENIPDSGSNYNRIFAPPSSYLSYISKTFPNITLCSQDVSIYSDFGAYTGENSSKILRSSGVKFAIIGHSERRDHLKETNSIVRIKSQNCIQEAITPIICVGESLDARKNGSYKDFILNQLEASIPTESFNNTKQLNDSDDSMAKLIIAYEPLWSIGSGIIPQIDEISEIISLIKNEFGSGNLEKILSVVYGGSVNKNNLKNIIKIDGLSGVLVGSASLKSDFFEGL